MTFHAVRNRKKMMSVSCGADATARVMTVSVALGLIVLSSSSVMAFPDQHESRPPAIAKRPAAGKNGVPAFNKTFKLTIVVRNESGKPLSNAVVTVRSWDGKSKTRPEAQLKTGNDGRVTFALPEKQRRLVDVRVRCAGYVGARSAWYKSATLPLPRRPVPKEFVFRLRSGVSIGGKVVDENGRPVANAAVDVDITDFSMERSQVSSDMPRVHLKTDRNGTWKTPANVSARFTGASVTVEHSDFVNTGRVSLDSAVERAQLRTLKLKLTLRRGFVLDGFVRGPDGKPVSGALVALHRVPVPGRHKPEKTKTNRAGAFRFARVGQGRCAVTVLAKGLAAETRQFDVTDELDSIELQLKPGNVLRLKIVDSAGKPIEGATVVPNFWRDGDWLEAIYKDAIPHKTDKDGRIVWNGAPKDVVAFNVFPPGPLDLMFIFRHKFTARKQEYVVTLRPALKVSLRVVDDETQKPISRFRVLMGETVTHGAGFFWHFIERHGENGALTFSVDFPMNGRVFRVSAKGYRSVISRVVNDDEGRVSLKFKLERSKDPQGLVVDGKGKPIAGAKIHLCVKDDLLGTIFIGNGAAALVTKTAATTDAQGRFSLDAQDGAFVLFIAAKAGYAFVTDAELDQNSKLSLRQWSRVKGTLMIGAKPGTNETISLDRSFSIHQLGDLPIYFNYEATTDEKGQFVFEKVPSHWPAEVSRQIFLGRSRFGSAKTGETHTKKLELIPGKTTTVKLGGTGRPIVGRLQLPDNVETRTGWHTLMSSYVVREVIDVDLFNLLELFSSLPPSFSFSVKPDGSFRVEDLPAGKYELSAEAHGPFVREKGKFKRPKVLGKLKHTFTIKPIRGGRSDKPHDLGTLKLK